MPSISPSLLSGNDAPRHQPRRLVLLENQYVIASAAEFHQNFLRCHSRFSAAFSRFCRKELTLITTPLSRSAAEPRGAALRHQGDNRFIFAPCRTIRLFRSALLWLYPQLSRYSCRRSRIHRRTRTE